MAWPVVSTNNRQVTWGAEHRQCVDLSYQNLWAKAKQIQNCDTNCCWASKIVWTEALGLYECNNVHFISNLLIFFVLVVATLVFLAPAFPLCFLFRWTLWSPFCLNFLRYCGATQVVGHGSEGDIPQVFLADGGHCDNSAMLPLLRRKRRKIVAVDASPNRHLESVNCIIKLAAEQLHCSWRPPMDENRVADLDQYLTDFALPRARYTPPIGLPFPEGQSLYDQATEILSRCEAGVECKDLHFELPASQDGEKWYAIPETVELLVSHARMAKDGHAYIYFHDDQSACTAFALYPSIRECFSLAHAVEDAEGVLKELDFLPREEARSGLRNYLHLLCQYDCGTVADVFFLMPNELTQEDRNEARESIKVHDRASVVYGEFPFHITGGEGYGWAQIDAYAGLAKGAAKQVLPALASKAGHEGSPRFQLSRLVNPLMAAVHPLSNESRLTRRHTATETSSTRAATSPLTEAEFGTPAWDDAVASTRGTRHSFDVMV